MLIETNALPLSQATPHTKPNSFTFASDSDADIVLSSYHKLAMT